MFKKSSVAVFAFLGVIAFGPAVADDAVVQAHPAVWHIGSGRNQITLLGSLHVLPANTDWVTPDILRAIAHTDVFVFEVPTDQPSRTMLDDLIARRGALPDGQSLRAMLPPDSQADYDAAIAAAHLSPSVTDHEQPWLASLQLTLADTMNRSYFPDAGVDYVLMSWATAHTRPVQYLETVDQQLDMLAPGDGDNSQLDDFESSLKKLDQEQNKLKPLMDAWCDGDVPKMGQLIESDFAGNPEAKKKLLTDRNMRWAKQIEQMTHDGRSFFITVGAAHLAGPEGVPALLRADGYTVDGP